MSNIFALNGATSRQPGTGLLVYDNIEHVFSRESNSFNSDIGLLRVPPNRLPTFQVFLNEPNLLSFRYRETLGGVLLAGVNFIPPVGSLNMVWSGLVGGVQKYCFQTTDNFVMGTPAPLSRWLIEIIVQDGSTENTYYTEEFITTGC